MPKKISDKICVILLVVAFSAGVCRGQAPITRPKPKAAPATAATVDTSEAMFATMCALYAAGFEGDMNPDNWSAYRSQMREKLTGTEGASCRCVERILQRPSIS